MKPPPPRSQQRIKSSKDLKQTLQILFLAILFLVGVPIWLVYLPYNFMPMYFNSFTHDFVSVGKGETLTLVGTRGQQLSWQLSDGPSVNGLWADPNGISLTLTNTSTSFSMTTLVTPPKDSGWESIPNPTNENFYIDGSFIVPQHLSGPVTQTLKGLLAGTIEYPDSGYSSSVGGTFVITSEDISIPVQVEIFSPTQAQTQEQQYENTRHVTVLSHFLLAAAIWLAPIILVIVVGKIRQKRKQRKKLYRSHTRTFVKRR